MKKYKRLDFLKLPVGTIYSKITEDDCLMSGLYAKCSVADYGNDWVEQNLIGEMGFPNGIKDGIDATDYQLNLRDSFNDFNTDLHCAGRDGRFDDTDEFVVWSKEDVRKLANYLMDTES